MNEQPFIIFQNSNFLIIYKPPYWKLDISDKYEKFSIKKQKKELTKNIKPLQIYIKFLLLNKFNIDPNKRIERTIYEKYDFEYRYNICHRYDVETSGGLLVSIKNENLNKYINIIANKNDTCKIYLTLVNGKVKQKNGFIYKTIECKRDNKKNFCYTIDDDYHNSKKHANSISYYNVIGYYKYNHKVYSLVHVKIFTGKTHQIRLHMKSLGHTIVTDYKYNEKTIYENNLKFVPRMFLHNIFLGFTDDIEYKFTIPLASDLNNVLNNLKHKKIYKDIYDLDYLFNIKL